MLENKKLVSIIIVTYNDAPHLERCVSSIYEKFKDSDSWEIVLVNNDKNQDVKLLNLDFSRINFIDHRVNLGFGAGNNMGAAKAQGEYLLFLNPDTQIMDDSPIEVFSKFENDANIGVVGAGIFTQEKKPQPWSAGKELGFLHLLKNNLVIFPRRSVWESDKELGVDWVSGAAFFMKKSFFEELGGFDEKFFMYFEDVDLCKRVREKGKKVIFFPKYRIMHICGGSHSGDALKNQKKNYYDSLVYYFKKHRSRVEFWIVGIIRRLFFV